MKSLRRIHAGPLDLPTREKERNQQINWQAVSAISPVSSAISGGKKKEKAAFDSSHFGCPGGAFFLGFMKPQTETIIHYVSTGVPGEWRENGIAIPDALRGIFDTIDLRAALVSIAW